MPGPIGLPPSQPLKELPPFSLANGWLASNPMTAGLPVKPGTPASDVDTLECVTEWFSNIGGLFHGRTYTFPDTDNGRELLAQRLAQRWQEVYSDYVGLEIFQSGIEDPAGYIHWMTGKPSFNSRSGADHAGVQETRSMRIYNVNGKLIMVEAWRWDASDVDQWRTRIELQVWYGP
jgi:hypothetical protein